MLNRPLINLDQTNDKDSFKNTQELTPLKMSKFKSSEPVKDCS